jgi:hypothetical protein
MIKVAGVWELGWNTPILEVNLWQFPLRDFGVSEWYMAPVSGIANKKVTEIAGINEAIELNPDLTPVYVDELGEEPLKDFEHPEDVLYIFGKAAFSPWASNGKRGRSIRIETAEDKALLWPHQCACLVLYDRMVKTWR